MSTSIPVKIKIDKKGMEYVLWSDGSIYYIKSIFKQIKEFNKNNLSWVWWGEPFTESKKRAIKYRYLAYMTGDIYNKYGVYGQLIEYDDDYIDYYLDCMQ